MNRYGYIPRYPIGGYRIRSFPRKRASSRAGGLTEVPVGITLPFWDTLPRSFRAVVSGSSKALFEEA